MTSYLPQVINLHLSIIVLNIRAIISHYYYKRPQATNKPKIIRLHYLLNNVYVALLLYQEVWDVQLDPIQQNIS